MFNRNLIPFETQARLLGEFDMALCPAACYGDRPEIGACLRVYGRPTPYYPGTRDTPSEPAGFDICRVTLSFDGTEMTIEPSRELSDWIDQQLEDAA